MKKLSLVLMLVLFGLGTMFAQKTVTGMITDDGGEALIGANVVVKGTTNGTITDLDGKFSLNVPEDATTLVVSYTGFTSQDVALDGSGVLNVTLSEGILLEEAVVTALNISRDKKSLGYALQSVSGDELDKARDPNAINALQGKVAGLQITSSSGNVGSSSRVVLRGANSISGNSQPLFVVNGVPLSNDGNNDNGRYGGVDYGSPLQDINPDDIESISVLKGANAAALYGSRATNGVILITLKDGKGFKKGGLGVEYSGNVGFSNPFRLPTYQNQFGQGFNGQFNYDTGDLLGANSLNDGVDESWGPAFDPAITGNDGIDNNGDGTVDEAGEGSSVNQYNGSNQAWQANPDNINGIFETGVTFTNSIAIGASSEKSNIRFSFTNMDQKGMVPNTDFRRNNANLAYGVNITDRLRIDGGVTYTRTDSDNRPGVGYDGDNFMQQTIWTGRQVDWADLRANYDTRDELGRYYNWNHNYQSNPYFTLFNNVKPVNRDNVYGNVRVSYEIADWLTASGRILNSFNREWRKRIWAKETLDFPQGQYDEDNLVNREINLEAMLQARKEVSDKIAIGGILGVNRRNDNSDWNYLTVNGLTVEGIYNTSNAAGNPSVTQDKRQKRVNSVFGSINFEYDRFLYLDLTLRNDWSSTLPEGNRSYQYPSASLGLVLSEAMDMGANVDLLKIRGSYAQVGGDTDPYDLRATYAPNASWSGTPSFAVPNELPGGDRLQNELNKSVEVGLEYSMWLGRLSADVTYYNSNTVDQIIGVDASPTSGYTNRVINAGTIQNQGVEVFLHGTPIKSGNFSWDIDLNWSKNTSLVKDLPEGTDAILLGDYWGLRLEAREGEPYGVFRGLQALEDGNGNLVLSGGLPQVDPLPDPNDPTGLAILGNITPDWIGGVRNTFNFKNLSLSVLIDGRKGSDIFSMSYMFGRYAGVFEESLEGRGSADEVRNGYVFDGVDGTATFDAEGNKVLEINGANTTPVSAQSWNHAFWRGSSGHSRSVFDGSFIKLREVNLSWQLPSAWFTNNSIQKVSVGVYGRNLALLMSNIPHVDPESAFSSDNAVQGFEFGQLPSARTIGVQLNASF